MIAYYCPEQKYMHMDMNRTCTRAIGLTYYCNMLL